ncbi:MAG: sugar phosphate isomerase/epimerase [Clostridiales bacterium]|nr:sugar phosphate isomerase/epimerase [Clostridiales bacterium]
MDRKIGAQYYTIRNFCTQLSDFDASCKRISDIGYKTVQLSGIGDFDKDSVKEILDKYNLKCVCTHRPAQNYLERLDDEIAYHKTIGCEVCGLGAMPGFNARTETIEKFISDFKPVAEKLKENGLIFAYHNHAFEFEKIEGKYVFDIITEGMDCDNFRYILDVYWLSYAGINPAEFIRARKGKIACVHFKDLKIKDNKPCFAEVGSGNIDWDDVIGACDEAQVGCALVEQDECDGDPFDSLKISYDFLSGKGFV